MMKDQNWPKRSKRPLGIGLWSTMPNQFGPESLTRLKLLNTTISTRVSLKIPMVPWPILISLPKAKLHSNHCFSYLSIRRVRNSKNMEIKMNKLNCMSEEYLSPMTSKVSFTIFLKKRNRYIACCNFTKFWYYMIFLREVTTLNQIVWLHIQRKEYHHHHQKLHWLIITQVF